MLDECKGDKFEEVLVSFSTIVLQKVLAAEKNDNPSIAKRLALARRLALRDQDSLLPLAVAHRASLTAVLRRKTALKTRYSDFQRLLDQKEQELAQRTGRLEAIEESGAARIVSNHVIQRIKRHFDIHWQGDPRWVDIIVKGGEHDVRDPLLETEFTKLWPLLKEGPLSKVTTTNQQELLQDLEKRIASQRARLQHWKAVKDDLKLSPKSTSSAIGQNSGTQKPQGIELNLTRHKDIVFDPKQLNRVNEEGQGTIDSSCAPVMTNEYSRLIGSMQAELTVVSKGARQSVRSRKIDRSSIMPVPLEDSEGVTESDDLITFKQGSAQDLDQPVAKTLWIPRPPSVKLSPHHANGADAETPYRVTGDYPTSLHDSIEIIDPRKQGPTTVNSGIKFASRDACQTQEDVQNPEVLDEDELLAQQIISSTRNAAPSPAKPNRSLVERTRQSMGFSTPSSFDNIANSDPTPILLPSSLSTLDSSPPLPAKNTTLLERTRQSMSLMHSTSLKPRRSVHRPRLSKHYPTNQFETPSKQQGTTSTVEEMTPPEKLFTQEADYASVFKSRPKIALSPTVSPEIRELETDELNGNFGQGEVRGD